MPFCNLTSRYSYLSSGLLTISLWSGLPLPLLLMPAESQLAEPRFATDDMKARDGSRGCGDASICRLSYPYDKHKLQRIDKPYARQQEFCHTCREGFITNFL